MCDGKEADTNFIFLRQSTLYSIDKPQNIFKKGLT
jgi:hypothetical protein